MAQEQTQENKIKLTINGKEIVSYPGKTILQVVHENKIDKIPTLCHDGRIEPYGSCFLCVVEIEGLNQAWSLPAATPIANGMKVHTDSEQIRQSRKTALELLLSNHYADCIGPCINNCPANVDAQGYIALISMASMKKPGADKGAESFTPFHRQGVRPRLRSGLPPANHR